MSRRMFSDEITTTDAFLDLPKGSQLLYFHLGMSADDDGFVANPKMTMRVIGSSEDELKVLFAKKFLLPFSNGVCVVKHWRINNQLRKDRYTETKYIKEKEQLFIRENGSYSFNPESALPVPKGHFTTENLHFGNHLATTWQPSIDKVSIGEDSIGEDTVTKKPVKQRFGELENVKLTEEEHVKLIERFGEQNTETLIFELDTYIGSKGDKYKSHYATLLSWAKRKWQEHEEKKINKKSNIAFS